MTQRYMLVTTKQNLRNGVHTHTINGATEKVCMSPYDKIIFSTIYIHKYSVAKISFSTDREGESEWEKTENKQSY